MEDVWGEEEDEVEEEATAMAEATLPDLVVGPPSAEALLLSSCVVGEGEERKVCVCVCERE